MWFGGEKWSKWVEVIVRLIFFFSKNSLVGGGVVFIGYNN